MSRPQVLIVGGGPAGLVLAHALARRGTVDITVVERDLDPFHAPRTTDRSYTIDITGHGLRAVEHLDMAARFEERLIRFRGVQAHRPIRRVSAWEGPGWTGSRGDILQVLLLELEDRFPGVVDLRWGTRIDALDAETGVAVIEGEARIFDLIVGCDGAGSVTRRAMERIEGFTTERTELANFCTMLELDEAGDALDPEYLHLLNGHPFTVAGAVNGRDKHDPRWFCMVGFDHEHRFGSGCCGPVEDPVVAARRYLGRHTDVLPWVSDTELARFAERRCHHIGKAVTCSSMHAGKAVLLGDAGAAFPPVGQGINAAMESAVVFDEVLGACGGGETVAQLRQACARFTEVWKPEADAASWIATRWTFSNLRMSAKLLVAELADVNVLQQAKHMPYSLVHAEAQARLARLGPLARLTEPDLGALATSA